MSRDLKLRIVETVASVYSYHLTDEETPHTGKIKALCGETLHLMGTSAPVSSWGHRSHLNEKYCAWCANAVVRRVEAIDGSR